VLPILLITGLQEPPPIRQLNVDGRVALIQAADPGDIRTVERDGKTTYLFTVRPGRRAALDAKEGRIAERAELSTRDDIPLGAVICQSYSLKLDSIPKAEEFVMLGQWHAGANIGKGPWLSTIVNRNGRISIRVHTEFGEAAPADDKKANVLRHALYNQPFTPNKWYDLRFHMRTGPAATGFVDVWVDGKQVAKYKGAVGYAEQKSSGYFKFGIYRPQPRQGSQVMNAEYRDVRYSVSQPGIGSQTAPCDCTSG
jgi:hypothetical protein